MKHLIPASSQGVKFFFTAVFIFVFCTITNADTSVLQAETPPEISSETTCGNCNMKPAMYPKWQTMIVFENNETVAFDGCKCMFSYSFNQQGKNKKIKTVWVKDFSNEQWINGMTAHYVINSKTMGPMGKELIPFAELTDAEEFMKKQGGTISDYNNISIEQLKPLMGTMMKM